MAVHVVVRSYGGENRKNRPEWYGKTMALASCVRAAEAAGLDLTFLNDGPVPEDRERLMRSAGVVRGTAAAAGMRASYVGALRWALAQPWPDDDVVWFSEDDYVYADDAFARLRRLVEARPDTTYFALYGSTGDPGEVAAAAGDVRSPRGWEPVRVEVDGTSWLQIDSTTSTFGARLGALRADLGIFFMNMRPHRTMFRDHDTCLVYQGIEPYRWPALLRASAGLGPGGARERLRDIGLGPFLIAANLRSHRRPENRRVLLAADPNLAAHLEEGQMPGGRDWAQVAADAERWLEQRPVDRSPAAGPARGE